MAKPGYNEDGTINNNDPYWNTPAGIRELTGDGPKYSGAGLPMGFVQGSDGLVYKQVGSSLVVASVEELRAAAAAERAATAGVGIAPANKQISTDERTGEAIIVDPRTGTITRTGQQIGFAGIDPRETAAAQEQRAAQERQIAARGQAIDLLKQSQNVLIRAAEGVEAAKVDRAKLKSAEAIANAQIKEQARQADLRAAVDQYQTALNLIPALGQLSLEESKRTQDILSNGNDFLARAFESRGGTSPLARVLQADQIGAVSGALSTLRGMIQDATAQSPMAKGGGFQPIEQTQIDAYTPANMAQASSTGFPGGAPGVAPLNDPGAYQYSPPAAIAPVAAPAPVEAGGGGGFDGAAAPAALAAPAAPAYTPAAVAAMPGMGGNIDPGDTGGVRADIPVEQQALGPAYYPARAGGLPGFVRAVGNVLGVINSTGASDRGMDNQIPIVPIPAGGYAEADRRAAEEAARAVPGMAQGGFTRAALFRVGEEKSGEPNDTEEVIANPTNAPLGVVPNEKIGGFLKSLPRYATGTDTVIGDPGSGAAGFGPSDVSMGYLNGANYDWYDAQTGQAGYGAFNPGTDAPVEYATSTGASVPGLNAP